MRVPIKFKGRESVNSGLNYWNVLLAWDSDLNLATNIIINYKGD